MSPLPPFEQQPQTPEGHEKPTWPWETDPKKAEAKQENKKDKKEPKKEKEEKPKPQPEKDTEKKEPQETTPEEKRGSLIEQALELVAKHEEEPVPRDAPTLARVMIAHRVVHLYEQLQHPEQLPENTSVEAIEATLDYIVQLDEKFNDPSVDTSPEIEASYHEILALAEATLREEPNIEQVVQDINNHSGDASQPREPHPNFESRSQQKTDSDQKPDPTEEEFARRRTATEKTFAPVAAAAALIYSITRLGRKKQKKQAADSDRTPDKGGSARDTTSGSGESSTSPAGDQSPTVEPSFGPSTETPSLAGPNPERTRPLPSRELNSPPPRRHTAPVAAAAIATTLAARRSIEQKLAPTQSSPDYTLPLTETSLGQHPEAIVPERSFGSDRKIEHMPILQLLSIAEGVSLGHGRYLRQEFESGAIDKDGLIKILKAQSKGQDYQWEFRQQAARFATLKATSPEFLHRNQTIVDDSENTQQTPSEADVAPQPTQPDGFEKVPSPTRPISLAPPHDNHPLLPKFTQTQQKPHTAQRILLITAAAIASLILIGILAAAIFTWLS